MGRSMQGSVVDRLAREIMHGSSSFRKLRMITMVGVTLIGEGLIVP